MSNIRVFRGEQELEYKSFVFPGGEVGVKFTTSLQLLKYLPDKIRIMLRAKEPKDLIELAMVKDAVERAYDHTGIQLVLPYIPYARQDRVCDKGEAFSLKVFANYLNYLNFESVKVYDPHSDVAPALINNVIVVTMDEIITNDYNGLRSLLLHGDRRPQLASPDAGANKKVAKLARALGIADYLRCDKLRDLATGKIIETKVYLEADEQCRYEVLIVDDICDGGATFIELAKVLKANGAKKVGLYVTHGIFSRGVSHLFENGIDEIWTTNSVISVEDKLRNCELYPNFHVTNII